MFSRIEVLAEKQLVGISTQLSFEKNTTFELWQSFMPKVKKEFKIAAPDLYSVEIYNDANFFKKFNPKKTFRKLAAIEVSNLKEKDTNLETFLLPSGLHAIFIHKGLASEGFKTYEYIFKTWLPSSIYVLDNRPHFAVMGNKYLNNSIDSEEEIWIPIK
jgi:AraC family transcriptional regulator